MTHLWVASPAPVQGCRTTSSVHERPDSRPDLAQTERPAVPLGSTAALLGFCLSCMVSVFVGPIFDTHVAVLQLLSKVCQVAHVLEMALHVCRKYVRDERRSKRWVSVECWPVPAKKLRVR